MCHKCTGTSFQGIPNRANDNPPIRKDRSQIHPTPPTPRAEKEIKARPWKGGTTNEMGAYATPPRLTSLCESGDRQFVLDPRFSYIVWVLILDCKTLRSGFLLFALVFSGEVYIRNVTVAPIALSTKTQILELKQSTKEHFYITNKPKWVSSSLVLNLYGLYVRGNKLTNRSSEELELSYMLS